MRGHCKWFETSKGYGFITSESGEDVFVHQSDIHARGFRSLAEQEPLEFTMAKDNNGRNKATSVTGPGGEYVKGDDRRKDDAGRGGGYGVDRGMPGPYGPMYGNPYGRPDAGYGGPPHMYGMPMGFPGPYGQYGGGYGPGPGGPPGAYGHGYGPYGGGYGGPGY